MPRVKETYDDNVYLQDIKPVAANVAAAEAAGLHPVQAVKASLVTHFVPHVGLDYKPCSRVQPDRGLRAGDRALHLGGG